MRVVTRKRQGQAEAARGANCGRTPPEKIKATDLAGGPRNKASENFSAKPTNHEHHHQTHERGQVIHANQSQAESCMAFYNRVIERTSKLVSVIPSGIKLKKESREHKYGMTPRARLYQNSPAARAARDLVLISAYKETRSITEAARIADSSPTTASRVLALAGVTKRRPKAKPKQAASDLYRETIKQISAKKTVSTK